MTRRHRHFPTIKSVDGVGISKWHEARLTKGRPGEILARDTVCGGPCCAVAPLPRTECAGTHMAEPLLAFRLGQPVKKRAADGVLVRETRFRTKLQSGVIVATGRLAGLLRPRAMC